MSNIGHEQVLALLPSLKRAPLVKVPVGAEVHKVTCPYCALGYAEVVVEVNPAQKTKQVEAISDPRRCVMCGRYFRIKPRLQLVGVGMEETYDDRTAA